MIGHMRRGLDQFSKEFFEWCEKQVASWGYDEKTSKKVDDLKTLQRIFQKESSNIDLKLLYRALGDELRVALAQ